MVRSYPLAMVIVVFLIAILGLIAGVAIPNFVKAREHAQALHQQQMEAMAQTGASTNFYIGQRWFPQGDSIEITSVERSESQMTVKGHYDLASADEASLWLNITATNDDAVPNQYGTPQSIHISKGRGDFELSRSHLVPGLPHVSMYDHHHSFAGIYFGTKDEAAKEANLDLQPEQSIDDATLGFNPVIETVVESGDGKKGYDLDRARVDYVGNTWDSRVDLVVRESPDGKTTFYFVGTRAEFMPDGDARWRMASWVLATNLALIPESPEAFTNVYGLSWHAAVIPQPPAHPETYEVETYEFQTREGNMGVLQVMGLTENPRGVKIRYKLVRKIAEPAAEDPFSPANRPSWLKPPPSPALATWNRVKRKSASASARK